MFRRSSICARRRASNSLSWRRPGIGQADAAVTGLADLSLYVMTPEFGAASQLEKIEMLDHADIVAIATEASRVSRADADGAGGTDASPAPFAFRRVAITPPDRFADTRRARADLVALRKSVTLQRAARRYLPPFPSARSDRPILAPCRPDQFRRRSRACAGR